TALELLKTLTDTAARARQELTLHLSLGTSLMATKGYGATEVEQTYTRAQELCLQVGESLQVAQVLYGRWSFNAVRGNHTASLALGEQLLDLAQRQQDSTLFLAAHSILGGTLLWLGEFTLAQTHIEQAGAFYDPKPHRALTYHLGQDPGLMALTYAAQTLWSRGYPAQALERGHHGLSLAQALSHPLSLVGALGQVTLVHLFRREGQEALAQAEVLLTLAHEHGFAFWLGVGIRLQGWALVERAALSGAREQRKAGLVQLREGLAAMRAMGTEVFVPLFLGALAQGYAHGGQAEEGLRVIAEALAVVEKNEERWNEAELYRLKGQLTLQSQAPGPKSQVAETLLGRVGTAHQNVRIAEAGTVGSAHPTREVEVEGYFLKAIAIARKQQAKSLELRATLSLARLWQQQGKHHEARNTLSEIYHWFTEGFDTADLQEAKTLIEELSP
ncbi:MAG: hypothetical protein HY268_04225, partial [Deltaproteobacteria bacterium]|nr:hypothetical protein [Deltaproteobacteria bacterium]